VVPVSSVTNISVCFEPRRSVVPPMSLSDDVTMPLSGTMSFATEPSLIFTW
jgi:hypothetical protein